jgi:nucleoside-diphosphate-sugar epimerase
MKIAVTGGNGLLGRNVVAYLLEQGHQVVTIDLVMSVNRSQGAEYLVVDACNHREMVGGLRACDALVHLAAHASPLNRPDSAVYSNNTISSYNALSAAAVLGITRVCSASSVNALGGFYSRVPRYDYFPLDEQHPSYADDPYSLSKWVLEQQADAFARRCPAMRIASLRFDWLTGSRESAQDASVGEAAVRRLWSYTMVREAARACLLSLVSDFAGHEVFYIVARRTAATTPSLDLAREHYPTTEIRGDLTGHTAFYSSAKAERLLGWKHED